jgi:hypothetical protein
MNKNIKYRIDKKDNYYKLIKLTIYENCRFKQTLACSINMEKLMKKAEQLIRITT